MLESAFLQLLKDDVYSLTSKVTNTFHLDLGSHLFFFFLNFIYFCSDLYDFFLSANFWFCLFFFFLVPLGVRLSCFFEIFLIS